MIRALLHVILISVLITPSLGVSKSFSPKTSSQDSVEIYGRKTKNPKRSDTILMSAFNIQSFGRAKMSQPQVSNSIIKIINRYDVILIQEIRDKSEIAIHELIKQLRSKTKKDYKMALSKRLGSGSHKEQLAYIYDASKLNINFTSSPADEDDVFYREPYIARIKDKKSGVSFIAVGAHLSPQFVIKEIEGMRGVVDDIIATWNNEKIVILGDLNASCDYITKGDLAFNALRTQDFIWWIGDDVDTTIHNTDCAYDRIITTPAMAAYATGHADRYNFSLMMNINRTDALKISDHYPVEIEFLFR